MWMLGVSVGVAVPCAACAAAVAQIWSAANFAVLIYILSGVRIPSQDEDGYILIIWAPGADSYENTRVMGIVYL